MLDNLPTVDITEFPRLDVRAVPDADNHLRGWAWKATVKGRVGGSLSGKTICLKDNICLAGVPCLFGTNAIKDFIRKKYLLSFILNTLLTPLPASVDATIVTRILEAGGTILGKATCENMSHGAASFTSPYGPVENPYAYGFSTGGSSSGCGALIGSGEIDLGMGGDQGGSIRIVSNILHLRARR